MARAISSGDRVDRIDSATRRRRPAPWSGCGTSRAPPCRGSRRSRSGPRARWSRSAGRHSADREGTQGARRGRTPGSRRPRRRSRPCLADRSTTPFSRTIMRALHSLGGGAVMGMADRDGERVGGILGRHRAGQQVPDHHPDLLLVGMARADDRFLHQVGGYSATGIPARAGASSTTPRAWPSRRAEPGLRFTKVSSTAASSAAVPRPSRRSPSSSARSRLASELVGRD